MRTIPEIQEDVDRWLESTSRYCASQLLLADDMIRELQSLLLRSVVMIKDYPDSQCRTDLLNEISKTCGWEWIRQYVKNPMDDFHPVDGMKW